MVRVEIFIELFERLAAELPPRAASVTVRSVQKGAGTVVTLIPANSEAADFSVHLEEGLDLVDFSFGHGTWELPFEGRYSNGKKDNLAEVEEMARAIIAGNCDVKRVLFWVTSRIHVEGFTYGVNDLPVFSAPPYRLRRYAPYVN